MALTAAQVEELEREFPGEMRQGYLGGLFDRPWPEDFPSPAYEYGRKQGTTERLSRKDAAA